MLQVRGRQSLHHVLVWILHDACALLAGVYGGTLVSAARTIIRNEGVRALFAGVAASVRSYMNLVSSLKGQHLLAGIPMSVAAIVPEAAITYSLYDFFTQASQKMLCSCCLGLPRAACSAGVHAGARN